MSAPQNWPNCTPACCCRLTAFTSWFIPGNFDPESIRTYLLRSKAVAVGEIGLDFFSADYPAADNQARALTGKLDMAVEFDLPVLLHCRKAYDRLYGSAIWTDR